MDSIEEFDSRSSLIQLLDWALGVIGPPWAQSLEPGAVADVYRSRVATRRDPWPSFGFELHMPPRHGDAARVDFCLMSWEQPDVLQRPATWAYDDSLPPLRVAPTHRFLEFDALGGDVRYMGQFFGVTDASECSLPPGLLRDFRRVLGRAPSTAALIEGRGGRWPAAIFPIRTASEWDLMVDSVLAAGLDVATPEQFAALQKLQDHSRAINVALAVDEQGRPLPSIGLEIFGVGTSPGLREVLLAAGAPVAAVEAFEGLRRRLPLMHTLAQPLVPGASLDVPWQRRILQLSHLKVTLRRDGLLLKTYLRLDTSAPGAAAASPSGASRYVPAVRSELRRALRDAVASAPAQIGALRATCPHFDLVLPIVRFFWNDALARVPSAELPLFAAAVRDSVVAAGVQRLAPYFSTGFPVNAGAPQSAGQLLMRELGMSAPEVQGASAGSCAATSRQIMAGEAPQAVMDHVYSVVLPVAVDWIESWRELAARVAGDREQLLRHFGIATDAPLVRVHVDAGDRHAAGRCVHLLWFAQGSGEIGIAYKPRDLRPDAAWYQLARELMSAQGLGCEHWPSVLARDGYGYVSLVVGGNLLDSGSYSRGAGRVLALLHLCDARDVHAENVVQTPAGPMPIDLECLWAGADDDRLALDGVPGGSIAATGFLPHWARTANGDWRNAGGVLCSLSPGEDVRPGPYAPVAAPPLPQPAELRAGFEEMYRLAMTGPGFEAIMRCARSSLGAGRRRLVRATRVYRQLMAELGVAATGVGGREATLRDIRDRLGHGSGAHRLDESVLDDEVAAISRGDVPRFVSCISPSDIVRRPSEADLAWQLRLLEEWSPADVGVERFAEQRLVIGWHGSSPGSQGWLGWEGAAGAAIRQLRWLPWTLYAGAVGPLLALAVMKSNGPDGTVDGILEQALPVYRRAALDALVRQRSFRWGLEGLSGHLRAVEALVDLGAADAGFLKPIQQAWVTAAFAADPALAKGDFTTGLAGAMGPLCRLAQQSSDGDARALVERLATALVHRIPAKGTDPSLAHGQAGIGLGLVEAGVFMGEDEWVNRARALWESVPVSAQSSLPVSWCRGHAGIALSRWVALQRVPIHLQSGQWQEVLVGSRRVLERAAQSLPAPADALSLCCGRLGVHAALRVLGREPSTQEWQGISRAFANRGNQSAPGLWTGLAGLVVAQHAPVQVLGRLIA
ncbi:MAG: hypothetical protein RL026_2770 [Pseudomonadota bacterium]